MRLLNMNLAVQFSKVYSVKKSLQCKKKRLYPGTDKSRLPMMC